MAKTSRTRVSRIVESTIAILWCIATLIFFNFFSDYIAIYHDGMREPLITTEFGKWLWIHNPLLILTVIGHSISITFEKYVLRERILLFLTLFGIASTATLLSLFPFNFSIITNANTEKWVDLGLRTALIVTIVAFSTDAVIKVNKLTRNLMRDSDDY